MPLLDDAVEELVMCPQMKISKHVLFSMRPQATDRRRSRGTRDVPTNENLQTCFSVCALKPLIDEAAEELVMCPQMKISKHVFQ
jgi:hypothetical protein